MTTGICLNFLMGSWNKMPALLGRAIVTAAGSYKDVGPLGQAAAQQLQRLLVCYKVAIYALPAIYP